MKLFKSKKRFAAVFAAIATVMTLGWALAAFTNVLNPVFGNDTAFANPPADACIHLVDGIHVNNQNANADIRVVAPCGIRKFQMKMWYAPSASGEPHNAQVLAFTSATVTARVTDNNPTHINVQRLPEGPGCFFQADVIDVTNPPNGGYPIVAAVTGGNRDCTPKPPVQFACTGLNATPGIVDQNNGNQAYTFTTSSSVSNGTIVRYDYAFGDGTGASVPSNSTQNSVMHTFAPGTYQVFATVTVKDLNGNLHTSPLGAPCATNITVAPPVQKLTCDDLTATPGNVQENGNQSYTLTAKASAQNVAISNYKFHFGDNSSDVTVNTSATTASATHTYAPGEYDAQVFVNGSVTSDACKVHIKVKEQPNVKLSCDSLKATAGAVDPANGNQAYSFTATATAENTTITSYDFAFGDGQNGTVTTAATTATTNHTYAPGEYTAMVTVNTATDHKTSDACKVKIKVKQQPGAKLICNSLTAVAGAVGENGSQSYTLNAAASVENATITSYVFNFGDTSPTAEVTTSATTASTTHVYQPGTWSASVTVNGKNAAGAVISSTTENCKVTIKVKTPECQPGVPEGSPKCFEYVCNAFTVTKGDNRTVTVASFNASSTNPNATLSKVVVDWGDNSADLETTKDGVVGQSHQFATDGSYTITAVAHFTVDGKDFTASGANCAQTVSYTTTPPPSTPPQVLGATTLVNTGPGSMAAIAAAVAAFSAIAYRFVLGRKLSN